MNLAPLAAVTRGDEIECIHFGAAAVVNLRGDLLYSAGDPDFLTFTRSTIKPFQAAPFLKTDGATRFDYDLADIALLCASHSGEAMHTDRVRSMLDRAGCDEHHLRCGCHVPLQYAAADAPPPAGERFNQLHNNCSGKHAGFLSYCVMHGHALESYLDPAHPLQQAVRASVAHFAGMPQADLKQGIDGCSAPNYALPLSRLAVSYARLASQEKDPVYGSVQENLFLAMTTHPELVSGTGRTDLAFMQTAPGDWVAKVGADGVQAIGVRSAGLGIAVKVADGSPRALYTATVSILRQLGLLTAPEKTVLAPWVQPPIRNLKQVITGEVRPLVELRKH